MSYESFGQDQMSTSHPFCLSGFELCFSYELISIGKSKWWSKEAFCMYPQVNWSWFLLAATNKILTNTLGK